MRDLVSRWVARVERQDGVAVVDDDGEHSARELLRQARELAPLCRDPVSGEPRTVLLQADNSWRTVVAALAAGLSGAVLALVNRHSTAAELGYAVDDVRPDAVLVEPEAWREWGVAEVLGPHSTGTALQGWTCALTARSTGPQRWRGGTVIGMTSGSTGRPKAVVQTERALAYAGRCTIEANRLRPGDPVAAIVPLSSTAAFCFGVALALQLGGPLVTLGRWNPDHALARIDRAGARWLMCVPTMALQLGRSAAVHGAPRALASMTVGGGPMDPGSLARAEAALDTKILRVFGMSECLGHTTSDPELPQPVRLGCDGTPFPGTDLRGVDPSGRPVPAGVPGLAQVRGPSLFLGYARRGGLAPVELTPEGYFPTGDLVVTHPDGSVTITGREKDVIIRGGRNIDIVEVESALSRHPGIGQACVVPLPDPELGERIGALIVPEPGHHLDLAVVQEFLAGIGLARTKWPEAVFELDELPKTLVGKVSRVEAKALAGRLYAGRVGAGGQA